MSFKPKIALKGYEDYDAFAEDYPDAPLSEEIEVLNLVLTKDNALAIINGEKKIDIRQYTKFYCDRLYDKNVDRYLKLHQDDPNIAEWVSAMKYVKTIHFHDRYYRWVLDVECTMNDLIGAIPEDIKYIRETYNDCTWRDLQRMYEDTEARGLDRYPLFFYFEIGKILKRENI